jgi:hypothetical protein
MKKDINHKAILTVYGLDTMNKKEIAKLQQWLGRTSISIGFDSKKYSKTARFRLMK